MQIASLQNIHLTETHGIINPCRNLTKKLDHYINHYELAFERTARVRQEVLNQPNKLHFIDRTLTHPEQFKSGSIRALIHLSRHLEELGEVCADVSGLTERLARNVISSGAKPDLSLVIASAIGRIISAQFYLSGLATHKVAGASLYALSSLVSLAVIGATKTKLGEYRTLSEIELAKQNSNFDHSARLTIARNLLNIKQTVLHNLDRYTRKNHNDLSVTLNKWVRYMSRSHRSVPENLTCARRSNCNYMWKNLHQYGPVTRGLMHFAYGTFQGINKLMVSYDKYLGTALSKHLMQKKTGEILGCRLGLTLSVATAAALSIPISTTVISLSTIGMIACGVAFLALLGAKANVSLRGDWKGNIQQFRTFH
jgi:hypothetical protein